MHFGKGEVRLSPSPLRARRGGSAAARMRCAREWLWLRC